MKGVADGQEGWAWGGGLREDAEDVAIQLSRLWEEDVGRLRQLSHRRYPPEVHSAHVEDPPLSSRGLRAASPAVSPGSRRRICLAAARIRPGCDRVGGSVALSRTSQCAGNRRPSGRSAGLEDLRADGDQLIGPLR